MSFDLKITNLKTGLNKLVNADKYTINDYIKTVVFYVDLGFSVKIIRGAR